MVIEMGPLEELRLHVDALASSVDANQRFFASVRHYIARLKQLLQGRQAPTQAELQILVAKVDEFWAQWRPSGDGGFYIPPRETADTDKTVVRMKELVHALAGVEESAFEELVRRPVSTAVDASGRERVRTVSQPCVFIGHGRSRLWARVKAYLEDELGLATVTYESESRAGDSIVPLLEKMLDQATFALLILTGEDGVSSSGVKRARQNVIHEAGLFQGRLGFKRAVLLVQEGIEEFSNVAGLQHIPFAGENVEQTFYELQRVLRRERQIAK